MKRVQAFINNISFPKTMEGLERYLKEVGRFDVDRVLNEKYVEWTAPRWSDVGDIVFFMHAKTALSTIKKLEKEYKNHKEGYPKKLKKIIENGIEHAFENYNKYGGKIFAIGKVCGLTIYDDDNSKSEISHFKGNIYKPIDDIIILENPVDISEFNSFINISMRGGITGVFGENFIRLKELILSKNKTKRYFKDSISVVLQLKDINKDNWFSTSREDRMKFFLEEQFRPYYTNYLLEHLTDSAVYRECICKVKSNHNYRIDNIITINNHKVLVEIKLNINNEKDLIGQMDKYCNCDVFIIEGKKVPKFEIVTSSAVIIDTEAIYLFNNDKKNIEKIYDLNNLKTLDKIDNLKKKLAQAMNL